MTGIAQQRQAIGKYAACHFHYENQYTEDHGDLQFILSGMHMRTGRQITVTMFMIFVGVTFVRVIADHHIFSFSIWVDIKLVWPEY
jgi:hypothetical protein